MMMHGQNHIKLRHLPPTNFLSSGGQPLIQKSE